MSEIEAPMPPTRDLLVFVLAIFLFAWAVHWFFDTCPNGWRAWTVNQEANFGAQKHPGATDLQVMGWKCNPINAWYRRDGFFCCVPPTERENGK